VSAEGESERGSLFSTHTLLEVKDTGDFACVYGVVEYICMNVRMCESLCRKYL